MVAEGSTWKTPSGEILRLREVRLTQGATLVAASKPSLHLQSPEFGIVQVWQDNLEEELELIRDIVDDYPYLAMGKPLAECLLASPALQLFTTRYALIYTVQIYFHKTALSSRHTVVHLCLADTEFPGIVARPVGNYKSGDFHYQTLR